MGYPSTQWWTTSYVDFLEITFRGITSDSGKWFNYWKIFFAKLQTFCHSSAYILQSKRGLFVLYSYFHIFILNITLLLLNSYLPR